MEKLTLEEYKALGEAIKQANKNMKLIQKFIIIKDIEYRTACTDDLVNALGSLICDLDNLSHSLEDKMDEDYLNDIIETIGFFN